MPRYIKALAGDHMDIVVLLNDATAVVAKAASIHQTSPVVTAALGRVLIATQLMSTFLKGDKSSVSLQVQGSGDLKKIYAYADGLGHLKGYVSHPHIENRVKANGKLDVGGVVGKYGKLIVTRDMGYGAPFTGQSDLVTGEIAEDLTHYFAHSEQQPSVVSLGVFVDGYGVPTAAGGLMIHTMPTSSETSIDQLEARLPFFRPMSEMLGEGMSLEAILEEILGHMPFKIIDSSEFAYKCDCNHGKIESALITLGINELTTILNEDGMIEMTCHFCDRKYHYDDKALRHLIHRMKHEAQGSEVKST